MTWTAVLVSTEKKNGMSFATVTFQSDDAQDKPFTETNFGDTFDDVAMKQWVYGRIQSLQKNDASYDKLKAVPPGPVTPIKPPDAAPP